MSLRELSAEGRLRPHKTSAGEVADLFRIVERDLTDAALPQLSTDRRFATAYNAALQLATIALHAAGYRAVGRGHHWTTFRALPEIMGSRFRARADFFDACRIKRNVTDYDRAGEISESEVKEILAATRAFRDEVVAWLKENHPDIVPGF